MVAKDLLATGPAGPSFVIEPQTIMVITTTSLTTPATCAAPGLCKVGWCVGVTSATKTHAANTLPTSFCGTGSLKGVSHGQTAPQDITDLTVHVVNGSDDHRVVVSVDQNHCLHYAIAGAQFNVLIGFDAALDTDDIPQAICAADSGELSANGGQLALDSAQIHPGAVANPLCCP